MSRILLLLFFYSKYMLNFDFRGPDDCFLKMSKLFKIDTIHMQIYYITEISVVLAVCVIIDVTL